jgi:hypothetical protein
MISGCGHLAFIERREPVNAAIEQFLAERDRGWCGENDTEV